MTLLVISSSDQRPESYAELSSALHRVPTFIACFALVAEFWWSHERFSRRFGLEDFTTVFLSLALVAAVLVFIYPLRMVISSGFWFITDGWVPSELAIESVDELLTAFQIFAVGFAVVNLLLLLLNRHALALADSLGLDARERLETRHQVRRHAVDIAVAMLSFALTFVVAGSRTPWIVGLPGFAYGLFAVLNPWQAMLRKRARAAL